MNHAVLKELHKRPRPPGVARREWALHVRAALNLSHDMLDSYRAQFPNIPVEQLEDVFCAAVVAALKGLPRNGF